MLEARHPDGGNDSMIAFEAESEAVTTLDSSLVRRMVRIVRKRRLFHPGAKILIAVSGGPDSVALLCLLHGLQRKCNIELSVVHVNF